MNRCSNSMASLTAWVFFAEVCAELCSANDCRSTITTLVITIIATTSFAIIITSRRSWRLKERKKDSPLYAWKSSARPLSPFALRWPCCILEVAGSNPGCPLPSGSLGLDGRCWAGEAYSRALGPSSRPDPSGSGSRRWSGASCKALCGRANAPLWRCAAAVPLSLWKWPPPVHCRPHRAQFPSRHPTWVRMPLLQTEQGTLLPCPTSLSRLRSTELIMDHSMGMEDNKTTGLSCDPCGGKKTVLRAQSHLRERRFSLGYSGKDISQSRWNVS